MDTSITSLGATKPKPCGTFHPTGGVRRLVWNPRQPLPGLHEGSCDPSLPDQLLLLGKGPDGPAVRTLTPTEAVLLLHGRKSVAVEGQEASSPEAHLRAAPRKLTEACLQRCSHQSVGTERAVDKKVGVCLLQSEEETRKALRQWLEANPVPVERGNVVGGRPSVGSGGRFEQDMGKGGRPGRSKGSSPLTPLEKCSKAMSRVLRHEAGTDTCPISEEGWVKWDDLIRHPKMQPFNSWMARQALEENDKDRFVARPDAEGVWWIAAWSGHTLDGVVGPSVQVEQGLLVHGSHRKHSGSIQRQGILKGRRDIHLHDPDEHSEKWRKDIQTKIAVDTLRKPPSLAACLGEQAIRFV